MENQRISLLRRKNHWGLTMLCVAVFSVLSPVLGVSVFLPQVLTLVPVVLLGMLGYVGPASALICSAILTWLCASNFGVWGGVLTALVILPVLIASVVVIERKTPFWQAVAACSVTMFASMGAAVALLTVLAGSDVVTAMSGFISQGLRSAGAMGDLLLNVMMQIGLLATPEGAQVGANGLLVLDPVTREKLLDSLVLLFDMTLRLEIPMQMATGSVAAGLLGQTVLRKGMLRAGSKVEYPHLETWYMPKGWGTILGGTMVLLYVLQTLVPKSMSTMFYVFSGVFDQLFSIQGIAAMCYLLKKRGKGRVLQGVVFVLGYFLIRPVAEIFGIADQMMDFTHRREELGAGVNPFDPRQGL